MKIWIWNQYNLLLITWNNWTINRSFYFKTATLDFQVNNETLVSNTTSRCLDYFLHKSATSKGLSFTWKIYSYSENVRSEAEIPSCLANPQVSKAEPSFKNPHRHRTSHAHIEGANRHTVGTRLLADLAPSIHRNPFSSIPAALVWI